MILTNFFPNPNKRSRIGGTLILVSTIRRANLMKNQESASARLFKALEMRRTSSVGAKREDNF